MCLCTPYIIALECLVNIFLTDLAKNQFWLAGIMQMVPSDRNVPKGIIGLCAFIFYYRPGNATPFEWLIDVKPSDPAADSWYYIEGMSDIALYGSRYDMVRGERLWGRQDQAVEAAPAPDSGLELGGNTTASISTRWGVLATTGVTTLQTLQTRRQHSDTKAATTPAHLTAYVLSGRNQVLYFSIV